MLLVQLALILFNISGLSYLLNIRNKNLVYLGYLVLFIFEIYCYLQLKEQNYYEIYKVDRQMNYDSLRQSYRQIMSEYHPDKNQNVTSEQFNKLKSIYEILKDESKRLKYDAYGEIQESNIDPLPTIQALIFAQRLVVYIIPFLIFSAFGFQEQNMKKMFLIILGAIAFGDYTLYENPSAFQQSGFLKSFTLFEFHIIYRIAMSFIISIIIQSVRQKILQEENLIKNLDLPTLRKMRKEHEDYLNKENSLQDKLLKWGMLIGLSGYLVVQQFKLI